jgi:hypothetical protein
MKRFLLFAFDSHYPRGGWDDFRDSYDTKEEAVEAVAKMKCEWWQVVDSEAGDIVCSGRRDVP